MRENSSMKWARCSTLTESIWSTPVRARVRENVRMVGVTWRGSRKPWATNAMRRACARLSDSMPLTLDVVARKAEERRRALSEAARQATTTPRGAAYRVSGIGSGDVEEFLAHGVHDRFHPRVQLQLLQDVAHVVLHRVLTDEQLPGRVPVVHSLGDQAEHLELALGEPWRRDLLPIGAGHLLELVDQLDGHGRADQRLSFRDDPDGLGHLVDGGVLEQVAGRTVLHRLVEVALLVADGQHDDLDARHELLDLDARLQARALGHPYVEQDDVGDGRDDEVGRADPVARFPDHLDPRLDTEEHGQSASKELLIVDDDHAHRLVGPGRPLGHHLVIMAEELVRGTQIDHPSPGHL